MNFFVLFLVCIFSLILNHSFAQITVAINSTSPLTYENQGNTNLAGIHHCNFFPTCIANELPNCPISSNTLVKYCLYNFDTTTLPRVRWFENTFNTTGNKIFLRKWNFTFFENKNKVGSVTLL